METKVEQYDIVLANGTFLIRDSELDTKAMPGQPIRGPIRK